LKDIKKLVKQIVKTIENPKASCGTLPWIEGPAKGKPTVRITEVDIVEGGLRIVCVGASVGSVVGLAFGAPPMVGAVVGGFVALVGAALVYFVPWKKLWSWLTKGWVHLIRFLILIRAAIKVGIVDWLKKMITVLIGWARSRSGTSNYNAEEYFPLLVAT
jgi:energy-converting hydrogenase Eha subunit E